MRYLLSWVAFCSLSTSLFAVDDMTKIQQPSTELPKSATAEAFYDASHHDNDYTCVVKVTKHMYEGELTGQKDASEYSKEKWYFEVALFDKATLVETAAFPAALLVKPEELDSYKPSMISFIPRGVTAVGTVGWDRELLSVENGHLFKYNLWAEKDSTTGDVKLSIDFGKRIPLYVKTAIDVSCIPWADKTGSVFFKAGDKFYKWDSQSESVSPVVSEPERPVVGGVAAEVMDTPEGLMVSILDKTFTIPSGKSFRMIDPLVIDEKTFAKLSEKSRNVMRELKLFMREKGVFAGLKKWMTNLEYETLVEAFDPQNPISKGVIIVKYAKGPKAGTINMEQPHGPLVGLFEDSYFIPWAYYRALKSAMRKGRLDDAKQWEDFTEDKVSELKRALLEYPQSRISKIFKDVLNRFLKVKDQKSWETWFERDNKDLNIELMFDWLASLDRETLITTSKEAGISGRRLVLIVDMYTRTDLYAGKKIEKIRKIGKKAAARKNQ